MPETLVLLHGFGGTHRAWDGVVERSGRGTLPPARARPPGPRRGRRRRRGRSLRRRASAAVLGAAPERFALCGYSLGGRVALHVALAAPERVTRLCVIAANPGIEDSARARRARGRRRAARRASGDGAVRGVHRELARAAAVRRRPAGGRASWREPISGATSRRRWRRRCAASAPARWSRCGIVSAS